MYREVRYFTIQSILLFLVPHVTEAGSDGQVYSSLMPLEVNSISLATGYKFKHESPFILARIYVSTSPGGNGLILLCLFLLLHLPSQLLWVQIHSSSGPCKQPMIWLQISCSHKAQILVLFTGRSRWNISLIMWKVAIKNARCVTKSCLQPKS